MLHLLLELLLFERIHSHVVVLSMIPDLIILDLHFDMRQILTRVAHHPVLQLLRDLVDEVVAESRLIHHHHGLRIHHGFLIGWTFAAYPDRLRTLVLEMLVIEIDQVALATVRIDLLVLLFAN